MSCGFSCTLAKMEMSINLLCIVVSKLTIPPGGTYYLFVSTKVALLHTKRLLNQDVATGSHYHPDACFVIMAYRNRKFVDSRGFNIKIRSSIKIISDIRYFVVIIHAVFNGTDIICQFIQYVRHLENDPSSKIS